MNAEQIAKEALGIEWEDCENQARRVCEYAEGMMPSILVVKALAHGIKIYPYQLKTVLRQSIAKPIPDKVIDSVSPEFIKEYIEALYLCGQEMAGDWTRGHTMLKSLGFVERSRKEGHRNFVSLQYPVDQESTL
tara:strand:- start:194 stop:595 length:402 start_codon:yes stop_codon:yes gene_type:complete